MKSNNIHGAIDQNIAYKLLLCFCVAIVALSSVDVALAASGEDIVGNTLCRLANNLNGGIAKGIATIAIFSVGVGLFLGKLNWGIAAATAAGVGIIFGSGQLVAFISGDSANSDCAVI